MRADLARFYLFRFFEGDFEVRRQPESPPESSNWLRSANQSTTFVLPAESSKIARTFADFPLLSGTGEVQILGATADQSSILSIGNRAGALSAPSSANKLRRDIAIVVRAE
jgi:hypothetical protein